MRRLLLVAVAAALGSPLFAVEGDFQWSGRLKPGQTIEIKGVNGGIKAEYSTGADVQVIARKTAWHSDLNSVRVEAVPSADGITICSVYPGDGGRTNECKPGDGGRMNTKNNDVKVEFTVHVPKGVRLVAKTVNGGVEVTGLQSDVDSHTVNGKIRVVTTGAARAQTVNGSIEVAMGSVSWNESLAFTTVNGSIDLTMPAGVSADVHASTVNGGLTTDFPLTVSGRWGPKSLNGKIGSGGHDLKLTTVNGGIRLHSGSGRVI
jgi:DUF4097 and DUF4098 domain-containing protein YvlB